MNVFSRSWDLFRTTLGVLRKEKTLALYPLMATVTVGVVSVLILGGGLLVVAANPEMEQALESAGESAGGPQALTAASIAVLFAYYLVVYFIVNFFMTALASVALKRLEGDDPAFVDGLAVARQRAGTILGYSAIAATIGVLLSLLRGRQGGGAGTVIAGLGGMAWNVATFLVVPLLAARGIGPVDAIRESAALLRRTWGEQLTGSFGLGAVFGLLMFAVVTATVGLAGLSADAGYQGLVVPLFVAGVVLFALLAVVSSTLNAIYRSAVYLYAEKGEIPASFDQGMITGAFRQKDRR